MRIEFRMEGGVAHFPGLARPLLIDTAALPAGEAEELERMVRAARFFDLRAGEPPRGAADLRQYEVTVEDAGRRHSVRLTDPLADPAVQALVEHLRARLARRR